MWDINKNFDLISIYFTFFSENNPILSHNKIYRMLVVGLIWIFIQVIIGGYRLGTDSRNSSTYYSSPALLSDIMQTESPMSLQWMSEMTA